MRGPSRRGVNPLWGEIWIVNFNSPLHAPTPPHGSPRSMLPTTGDEIYKRRPALVVNKITNLELDQRIVVPLRSWKGWFAKRQYYWIIRVKQDAQNGLNGDSGADTFQVKALSTDRFIRRIGTLQPGQLRRIVETIAFHIGYPHLKKPI